MKRILVTGSSGQIGTELKRLLIERFGMENVVGSDLKEPAAEFLREGPFERLDVTCVQEMERVIEKYRIDTVFHLAAILSAVGERNPHLAWKVNMDGLYNVLELSRKHGCAVFVPSSIAAFGPGTPKQNTPQDTLQRPTSMYGVTKVAGELLCDYYFSRYGVDVRGVRYPGIISNETLPGGGTTDYAVEIFYEAIRTKRFTCFLKPETALDMMYMPDALSAAIQLMEAPAERLVHRNAFNVTAMSITPATLAAEIRRHIPEFEIEYQIDPMRQAIADSWPDSLDDSAARREWGWTPQYDLESMTLDMIQTLKIKLES
ncbi:MAG: L-threonine 3-dehydrogenase [Acidobacteriota bacterium]|jgi:nucleoside-diphosphate-sugar epimerase|nr:L-threonine 3-dehydrogenase [Acidobacteriota bacterium]